MYLVRYIVPFVRECLERRGTASGRGLERTAERLPRRHCSDVNGVVSHDCPTFLALGTCTTSNDCISAPG